METIFFSGLMMNRKFRRTAIIWHNFWIIIVMNKPQPECLSNITTLLPSKRTVIRSQQSQVNLSTAHSGNHVLHLYLRFNVTTIPYLDRRFVKNRCGPQRQCLLIWGLKKRFDDMLYWIIILSRLKHLMIPAHRQHHRHPLSRDARGLLIRHGVYAL